MRTLIQEPPRPPLVLHVVEWAKLGEPERQIRDVAGIIEVRGASPHAPIFGDIRTIGSCNESLPILCCDQMTARDLRSRVWGEFFERLMAVDQAIAVRAAEEPCGAWGQATGSRGPRPEASTAQVTSTSTRP